MKKNSNHILWLKKHFFYSLRSLAALMGLIALFTLLGTQPSCGTSTAGEEVEFDVSVAPKVGEQRSIEPFVNAEGWEVDLTRADLLIGPLYLYSGEARASVWERLLGISTAYACAASAQFQSGEMLGELPYQFGVNLLDGETLLAERVLGQAGTVRSVELHLQNPGQITAGNSLAESNPTSTFVFEGVARKDEHTLPFSGRITLPEEGTYQVVDSIAAEVDIDEGSDVLITVAVDRWFERVDFAALLPSAADSMASKNETENESQTREITPGTQPFGALALSLRSRAAFTISER